MCSRLRRIFDNMRTRCYNKNCARYKDYGGRGIDVCAEWNTVGSCDGWKAFKSWALAHGYADNLTMDRIDNSKGYSPENCRWVSMRTQNNNRRSNYLISYKGVTRSLAQWCDVLKLNYNTITMRLRRGWTIEQAFETAGNAHLKMITYNGRTQHLQAWCNELGLNYKTMAMRLKRGWTVARAFGSLGVNNDVK